MANAEFIGLETATSLLISYETLALAHKRSSDIEKIYAKQDGRQPNAHGNYKNAFALLIINASIIEGTLRSIISDRLLADIRQTTEEWYQQGKTSPSKPELVLWKYQTDLETQGSWHRLKEQYSFYLDVSLDHVMGKGLAESIEVLFVLRNVLAHGTAIVHPKMKMDESMKGLYPYRWQLRLQQASVYFEQQFKKGDIFKNLADYSMPEHFLEKTKELFAGIEAKFSPLPPRAAKTVKMLNDYNFGFVHYTR